MTRNDIFTWCESVGDEIYSYVEGVVFDDVDDMFDSLCDRFKGTDVSLTMDGFIDELDVELAFLVMGNGVNVVLLFNNVERYGGFVVESVVTSKVTLTL